MLNTILPCHSFESYYGCSYICMGVYKRPMDCLYLFQWDHHWFFVSQGYGPQITIWLQSTNLHSRNLPFIVLAHQQAWIKRLIGIVNCWHPPIQPPNPMIPPIFDPLPNPCCRAAPILYAPILFNYLQSHCNDLLNFPGSLSSILLVTFLPFPGFPFINPNQICR